MCKGQMIEIEAGDGARIGAYHVTPFGVRRGGLVLIQEIFGITEHIKDIADDFCAEGYEVLAPALFDREEPGFIASADEMAKGSELSKRHPFNLSVEDAKTCAHMLKPNGLVFSVGYCYGGSVAYALSCRSHDLSAVSSYYGKFAPDLAEEKPNCPVICHFGKRDTSIPLERVEHLRMLRPEIEIHLYDAGHGFNSPRPANHEPEAARIARDRTLDFFRAHGA
ncbi:carboxymethylenebutenolidase [Rhizomicrobium palustre]|uniref:Carboxymethylenebutenolidase n=1 Tax=Rhizomicrobium palustre TaxID=189966 RepID=A0A846MX01_9PROT|nr:dienelactone hydrolase family protein [Rhizomicrobium palustre]NIK87755.1 carboxymethylenebutenolidase [Rhizomicrobium palustre]